MIDRQHVGAVPIPIAEVVVRHATRFGFGNAARHELVDAAFDMKAELVVDLR
jgi:hypothetical protein